MAGDAENTGHFISRMGNWKKRGGSLSSWKLVLVIFVLKEVQTGQHRHEFYFTAVGTTGSLLNFTMVSFIDDIQLCSYHKRNQISGMMECIPSILSANFSEQMQSALMKHEEDFHRLICYLEQNDTQSEVPPEVTVSRHDALDGTITLSCTATGFYPHSILLGWEKGNEHAPWGKQSSSGTLPNPDGTFYLQVTLEFLPGDPGTGYACVVEHTELKAAALYPVPGKPNKEKLWATALTIMIIVILVVSCALASITRKEKKAALAQGPA
ncbi:T-cell surface glycoprotein CD1b-3-like isoform 2-T2 [Sarcophilus harrisii]